jgi:hypothetical protein
MIWEFFLLILVSLYVLLRLTSRRYSTRSRFLVLTAFNLLAILLPYGDFWGFRWIMAPVYILILSANLFFAFGPKVKTGDPPPPKADSAQTRITQVVSVLYLGLCWVLWAFFPVPDIRPLPGSFDIGYHRLESPIEGQSAFWQVWYPTDDVEWSSSDRYLPRPFAGGNWEQFFRHEARNMGKTLAKLGAAGYENWEGATPGVYFLPPEGRSGEDFSFLLEALASRGFVVVSPLGLTKEYKEVGFFWPDLLQEENNDPRRGLNPSADEVRRVLIAVETILGRFRGTDLAFGCRTEPSYYRIYPVYADYISI